MTSYGSLFKASKQASSSLQAGYRFNSQKLTGVKIYSIILLWVFFVVAIRVVSSEISGNFLRNFSGNFRKNNGAFPE